MSLLLQLTMRFRTVNNFNSLSMEMAAGWLAGFIDGEGCVYSRNLILPNGKRHQHRVVTISNTDPDLIEFAAICFRKFGIHYSLSKRNGATERHKNVFVIEIRRGFDMDRIKNFIPIQAKSKRGKLRTALKTYKGLHCICGVLRDKYSKGCENCRSRKWWRTYRNRRKKNDLSLQPGANSGRPIRRPR